MYVAGVMRQKAVSVEPSDSVTAAGNLMVTTKLRSLPVIGRRQGRSVLVGMLSRGDVLRWLRSQLVEGTYVRQEKALMTPRIRGLQMTAALLLIMLGGRLPGTNGKSS